MRFVPLEICVSPSIYIICSLPINYIASYLRKMITKAIQTL